MYFDTVNGLDDESYTEAQLDKHDTWNLRFGKVDDGWVIDVGGDRNRTHHFLSDKVLDDLAKYSPLYGSMVKQLVTLEAKARAYDELSAKLAKMIENAEE